MFVDEKKHGEATPDLGTLRVDRILMLADEIEKPTLGFGFDMANWCGSACCIGGHAQVMFTSLKATYMDDGGIDAVQEALGLTDNQVPALFRPWDVFGYENVPLEWDRDRSRAAHVLRHLATTGKVDWNIA